MRLWSLLIVWPKVKYGRGNGSNGDKVLQKDICQHTSAPRTVLVRALTSRQATVDLCLHGRSLDTQRQVCGVTAPFSWVLLHTSFFCSLQESVSSILCNFCNQIPLVLKSHWVFSVPCWVSRLGPRTFATWWELLWYNCSPVCGLSAWWLYNGANGDLLKEDLCHMPHLLGVQQQDLLFLW